jgi:apolipoprotein N-acyltransferase
MAFAVNYRRVAEAFLVIVVSAGMIWFGNGLDPLWPLMWIALAPVLVFALRSSWWAAGITAAAAMLVGNLNMWHYFIYVLHMPISAWFGVFSVASVLFALAVLLFRALAIRGTVWSALIALPAVWVSIEYLRNLTTPHGTAGSLAYSQLRFLPFLQLASVTGPWGMTFLLLLFPSTIALGWYLRKTAPRQAVRVASVGLGAVVLALLFGAVRLAIPEEQMVRVGLIASDEKENDTVADPGENTERLFLDYANAAQGLTERGAQAIVIPEKVGVTLEGSSGGTDAVMQSLAEKTGATVVAGVVDVDAPVKYNEARVYEPGSAVQRYDKQHMLPPFESNLKPGTTLTLLPKEQQPTKQIWGVAICKDMDFASPARSYGKAGAGLMLVPAWDFAVDRSWHGHIAVMRGVEDGFSIARAAKNGYLTVSDDRGRIVGETRSDSAPFATLLVDVPAKHNWTVYQVMGDWFAWVSIALLISVLLRCMKLRSLAQD